MQKKKKKGLTREKVRVRWVRWEIIKKVREIIILIKKCV